MLNNFSARPAVAEHLRDAIRGSQLELSSDRHLCIITKHLDEIRAAELSRRWCTYRLGCHTIGSTQHLRQ